jgi:hypothetical protein
LSIFKSDLVLSQVTLKEHEMLPEKVHFTHEKETMLITLYGRALQSRSKHPILRDTWAEDAIHRIDYDFEKLKVGQRAALLFASRGRQLDIWTTNFLSPITPTRPYSTWGAAWTAGATGSIRRPARDGSMWTTPTLLSCVVACILNGQATT